MFKRRFFNKEQEVELVQTIRLAEKNTSGEIKLHIKRKLQSADPLTDCKVVFERLQMHKTRDRNAVLFLFLPKERKFALYGDEGIHQKVSQDFWDAISSQMKEQFKQENFLEGLKLGILTCGERLKEHFPYQKDDVNELSDEITED